jgi:hypothetical protein
VAFPTTVTGFIFAVIGWILSYSVLLILGSAVGLRSRATF